MLALIVGSLLAVSALVFVLLPLLVPRAPSVGARNVTARVAPAPTEDEAVVALREIEFDRATGKLSDADYDELRTRYTMRALESLRAYSASPGDVAEAAVLAYRSRLKSCVTCGPRSEVDAIYCSSCGTYLPGACGSCGAVIRESGAAYCTSCGQQLAA